MVRLVARMLAAVSGMCARSREPLRLVPLTAPAILAKHLALSLPPPPSPLGLAIITPELQPRLLSSHRVASKYLLQSGITVHST